MFRDRFRALLTIALVFVVFGVGVDAQAKSVFKKKADKYGVYQLFFKKGSRYNILAKYAEQLGSAYEKSIKYRIYNDLRAFYKSFKEQNTNNEGLSNIEIYAGNRRDFVGCTMGMNAPKYKNSGRKLVPWANFYVMRSGVYQTMPVFAGSDIRVVICTTMYRGDNILSSAYSSWVYKRLDRLFASLSEFDGISAARIGDKPAFDDSPVDSDDLVEALLGEPIKSDPKQWREDRIGKTAAEADEDFSHWELGPYFNWSKISLPNGWMFAGFLGGDGMLYHVEEVMLQAVNKRSTRVFNKFSTHASGAGAVLAVKEFLTEELDDLAPVISASGGSLITSLPSASEVFPEAKIQPLHGDGSMVLAAARSNMKAYKTYFSLNASTALSRAYRAYTVIEQALARGAFDDVQFFARKGLQALKELPKERVPQKAQSVFKQLSNKKLLPLIRQNIWIKQLANSQYSGLEKIAKHIDGDDKQIAELFSMHNLAGVASITPRYMSTGEISPQFKRQLLWVLKENLAYLFVLDALHGVVEGTVAQQLSSYGNKGTGSVMLPVIGFDQSVLASNSKDNARFYKVEEVATIGGEGIANPVSIMIGLRQRVEVKIDGAVVVGGMTVKLSDLIKQSSSIACPDLALLYKFVENGKTSKELNWRCLDKDRFLFNPKRKMFVDYGTLYFKVNKIAGFSKINGIYVFSIFREIVREGSFEESSPLINVRPLFVFNE